MKRKNIIQLAAAFTAATALSLPFLLDNDKKENMVLPEPATSSEVATDSVESVAPSEALSNTTIKRDNFIAALQRLSRTHQYIILGDTNHSSPEIRSLLSDPAVIKAIADSGIDLIIGENAIEDNSFNEQIEATVRAARAQRDITVEELQQLVDTRFAEENDFQRGHIRAAFAAAYYDIKLRFADERMKNIDALSDEKMVHIKRLYSFSSNDINAFRVTMDAYINSNPNARLANAEYGDIAEGALHQDNLITASNIKNIVGDARAVISYGVGHTQNPHDLDEILGAEKTVTIDLFPTPESTLIASHPDDENARYKNEDLPDYFYNISTDELVRIEPGQASEALYRSRLNYSMSREEYDEAVSKLPLELKPFALPYTEYDEDWQNNTVSYDWYTAEDLKNPSPASTP